jgi:hypothetical protein
MAMSNGLSGLKNNSWFSGKSTLEPIAIELIDTV